MIHQQRESEREAVLAELRAEPAQAVPPQWIVAMHS